MHYLSDKYLMMIEPVGEATAPLEDDLTRLARDVFLFSDGSKYVYRGFHVCVCGAVSDNLDHVLPDGTVTSSLLPHYVACHRDEIPPSELEKLKAIAAEMRLS